jgi:2-polyprenyl-3-methyl-5-hydroxy-6-metoxy-1,4-benzoquinol methylase
MSASEDKICPVCGGSSYSTYRFGLLRCDACGLVLSPAIWQPMINDQMEDEWFGENYQQRKSSFWVSWFESLNNRRTLSRLVGRNETGKRLLEIGVGSGSFLRAAKAQGYDVMGCDLSKPICERVESEIGVPMHCGPLDGLNGHARFDVVVMNHVLEHVQQPVAFLQGVRRLLAPGGIVHIAVPNIACWEARFSGWTSYEPYHLSYFDYQTLARVVEMAWLLPGRIATHESFSGWFLALLRTALGVNRKGAVTRISGVQEGGVAVKRSQVVEHAYRLAMVWAGGGLWPLRYLQAKLGFGDEIICVAQLPVNRAGE